MSSPAPPDDVILAIEAWLSESHEKILSFWIGARWELWARYELYMALEKALGSSYIIFHGVDVWKESDEQADLVLEPRGDSLPVIVQLRCETVSENEGSYERFRDLMDADMTRIRGARVENDFAGGKALLVGFSGEPSAQDSAFRTESQPRHFRCGEVYAWVAQYDIHT